MDDMVVYAHLDPPTSGSLDAAEEVIIHIQTVCILPLSLPVKSHILKATMTR
jgi:hypothetical protein